MVVHLVVEAEVLVVAVRAVRAVAGGEAAGEGVVEVVVVGEVGVVGAGAAIVETAVVVVGGVGVGIADTADRALFRPPFPAIIWPLAPVLLPEPSAFNRPGY